MKSQKTKTFSQEFSKVQVPTSIRQFLGPNDNLSEKAIREIDGLRQLVMAEQAINAITKSVKSGAIAKDAPKPVRKQWLQQHLT